LKPYLYFRKPRLYFTYKGVKVYMATLTQAPLNKKKITF